MTTTFLRLVYITTFDPPYVPLGRSARGQTSRTRSEKRGIATGEYEAGDGSGILASDSHVLQNDPDSPGLELFYTKDIFVCQGDGRPKYCHECANWKPDRTHHCSSSGRCIRKMDHFCPWVGGPIGENNFKYFLQFTAYTALYCLHLLIVMAIYIHQQITTKGEELNRQFATIIALAAFFGLFTATMTITSIDLAANNLTQVEKLGANTREHILAVHMPNLGQPGYIKPIESSWYRQITYPLGSATPSKPPPNGHYSSIPDPAMTMVDTHAASQSPGYFQNPVVRRLDGISSSLSGTATGDQEVTHPSTTRPSAWSSMPKPEDSLTLQSLGKSSVRTADLPSPPVHALSSSLPGRLARHTGGPAQEIELTESRGMTGKSLSPRDFNATRTFGILRMPEPGSNPWDLGSGFLNLKTVLGTSIIDWLLPIRRSPCCNHEDPESQFLVGPAVDITRASYNFIETRDIRARGGCTLSERAAVPRFGETSEHARMVGMSKKYVIQVEKMEKVSASKDNKLPQAEPQASIQLQSLNHHALSQSQ